MGIALCERMLDVKDIGLHRCSMLRSMTTEYDYEV